MNLADDGVQVYPGVFAAWEASQIRREAYRSLNRTAGGRNTVQMFGGRPALLFWPSISNEVLNGYRTDERLAGIVREHLGDDVKQVNNQVYFREPGDGDSFAWHQDIVFRQPAQDFPGIEDAYLQTVIVVDEITEDNGAVEYILGSHKTGRFEGNPDQLSGALRRFHRDGLRGVKLTAKPGDVVVWSVMVVHGSEANESDRPRMVYMNGFARADASVYNPMYLHGGEVVAEVEAGAFK